MITDIITSIKDMVHAPVNPFFSVAVKDGQYECGNRESYYAKKLPDETFSYDISNNKVLANADEFGTLKTVTFYRGCYTCDDIPGVWVSKDFGQAGPFYFKLTVEGQEVSLRDGSLPCQSDLAENLIPRAAFTHPRLTATVLSYAPISADGKRRPRALVYGLYLENTTDGDVKGTVIPPDFSPDKDYFTIPDASGKMVECGAMTDERIRPDYTGSSIPLKERGRRVVPHGNLRTRRERRSKRNRRGGDTSLAE